MNTPSSSSSPLPPTPPPASPPPGASSAPATPSYETIFRFLLKHTPDQIYVKDRESRFLCISNAGARFLANCSPEEVIGKTDFDFFAPEFAAEARKAELRVMETGEPLLGKVEHVRYPDGSDSWNHTSKFPLCDENGNICGICGINKYFGDIHTEEAKEQAKHNILKATTAELQEHTSQLETDLNQARKLQDALLPHGYPTFSPTPPSAGNTLAFTHYYQPLAILSGDFFDIIPLPTPASSLEPGSTAPSRYGVFICDVVGHGAHAALITAIIHTLLEELHSEMADPGLFMSTLNQRLHALLKHTRDGYVGTAFFMVVDTVAREVTYTNAAHPAGVLIGPAQPASKVEALQSEPNQPKRALGLSATTRYLTSPRTFLPGERLFLFTDGLYGAESPEGEGFGRAALTACFARNAHLPTQKLLEVVVANVSAFSRNHFNDDVSIVAVEYLQAH